MAEKENKKEEAKKEVKDTKKVAEKKETKKQNSPKTEKSVKETKKEEKKTENKDNKKQGKAKEVVKEDNKKGAQKVVDTKKFEVKKEKASNKNKKNKIVGCITIIVILAIVAVLTFLIVTSSDPKKSIDGMLTNLKAGNFEKAQEFMTGEEFLKDKNYNEETQKLLFDKIAWKVKNVSTEKDKATVELDITNKDFSVITENCMKKMLSNIKAVIQGNVSNNDIEKYFIEELKNEDVQTKTETVSIELERQDKKWKVVSNDELIKTLLPGLQDTVNFFN